VTMRAFGGKRLTLTLIALAACGLETANHRAPAANSVRPGTYDLRICRVVCDSAHPANVIQAGFIVLDTAPIRLGPLPDSARRLLDDMKLAVDLDGGGEPNGCYALDGRDSVPSYAHGWGGGLVRWQRIGATDSIAFALIRTADSGHEDTVAFTPRGFTGTGRSWGEGTADWPIDLLAGDYLGAPDQRRCREAIAAYAETVRKLEREIRKLEREMPKHPERRLPPTAR